MRERALVLVLFFLSGACGLIYEVVWTRSLSLVFGITVFATSAVLAAYMGGLALGSYIVGRSIDRHPNPLRIYALLEAGIGLYALALPYLFKAIEPVYLAIAQALEGHFILFNFARGILAAGLLLIPTTLMGGTVPAIGRYLVTRRDTVGWNIGLLYGLNTLGAVVGCVATGFVLLPWLGMAWTTTLAAAANLGIAAVVVLGGLGRPGDSPTSDARAAAAEAEQIEPATRGVTALVAFVFAASGFAALAYEVVWTRVLVVHLHNTTYAFTTMLAVFLAGIAVGNAVLMRAYDRLRHPLFWLGVVEFGIGLSIVAAATAYASLHSIGADLGITSWPYAVALMFGRAGLVLLPSALLLGMTFPLVARIVCREVGTLGRRLANVYAANTAGAILGSLAGGFLLVPLLGLRGTLLALSALNTVLALACWVATAGGVWSRALLVALVVPAVLLPWKIIPRDIFFNALQGGGGFRLIYYAEGVTDTSGVWEDAKGERIVTYGDMRGTAGTGSDRLNRTQGHLAHLLHPHPTRSLQIGFGVGNTLAAAAMHPEVEQLDCAELSPHVRETAPFFWTNEGVLEKPKVHLIVDDGRNYLMRTPTRYDVVTLEPPDIYTAEVVNLYTEEFYRLAARAMAPDGLLCQWIPTAEMPELELRMLVRAFVNVFPETTLWEEGKMGPLLLVGTRQPMRIDRAQLARRMSDPVMRADLARIGIADPDRLFELFIAGSEGTRRWVSDVPPVTDDRTYVDFSTPKAVYSGFGFGYFRLRGADFTKFQENMTSIVQLYQRLREPIQPLLVGTPAGGARVALRHDPIERTASVTRTGVDLERAAQ